MAAVMAGASRAVGPLRIQVICPDGPVTFVAMMSSSLLAKDLHYTLRTMTERIPKTTAGMAVMKMYRTPGTV